MGMELSSQHLWIYIISVPSDGITPLCARTNVMIKVAFCICTRRALDGPDSILEPIKDTLTTPFVIGSWLFCSNRRNSIKNLYFYAQPLHALHKHTCR